MDDGAAELLNAFKGGTQVADGEVGEGGGVAGTRPALVDSKPKAVILDLPPGAGLCGSWDQLGTQHTAPETASAIGVVSGELDEWSRHGPEYAFIPADWKPPDGRRDIEPFSQCRGMLNDEGPDGRG